MKTLATIALTLAALMSGSLAASAGADQPAHRGHSPHRMVHRRSVVSTKTLAPANPMFEPYAHPGEGDDDGLSRDPDDCMKGCIGGNPG